MLGPTVPEHAAKGRYDRFSGAVKSDMVKRCLAKGATYRLPKRWKNCQKAAWGGVGDAGAVIALALLRESLPGKRNRHGARPTTRRDCASAVLDPSGAETASTDSETHPPAR